MNRDVYIQFLEHIRDAKSSPGFTNIELNLYKGLHDPATLTELAVLVLYGQVIGQPYMSCVCSVVQNALKLGEFHDEVKKHCQAIIKNPDLLLATDASPQTGALGGGMWDCPDLLYHVSRISKSLPGL